jgi:hypothetical protein
MKKVFSALFALRQIYAGACADSPCDLHPIRRNTEYFIPAKNSVNRIHQKQSEIFNLSQSSHRTSRGHNFQIFSRNDLLRRCGDETSLISIPAITHFDINIRRTISINGSSSCLKQFQTDKVQIANSLVFREVEIFVA